MSLYKILQTNKGSIPSFEVKKFDSDFNCLATYHIVRSDCDCPAWRGQCRHLAMVQAYKKGNWPAKEHEFYDYDKKRVVKGIEPGG